MLRWATFIQEKGISVFDDLKKLKTKKEWLAQTEKNHKSLDLRRILH